MRTPIWNLRVAPAQLERWRAAASAAGLTVSAWAKHHLDAAAGGPAAGDGQCRKCGRSLTPAELAEMDSEERARTARGEMLCEACAEAWLSESGVGARLEAAAEGAGGMLPQEPDESVEDSPEVAVEGPAPIRRETLAARVTERRELMAYFATLPRDVRAGFNDDAARYAREMMS